jgi:hypothetical protein
MSPGMIEGKGKACAGIRAGGPTSGLRRERRFELALQHPVNLRALAESVPRTLGRHSVPTRTESDRGSQHGTAGVRS